MTRASGDSSRPYRSAGNDAGWPQFGLKLLPEPERFGESLPFSSSIIFRYALLVWLFFHLFVIFYEEPALTRKFGTAYEEYCKAVRRRIPRGATRLEVVEVRGCVTSPSTGTMIVLRQRGRRGGPLISWN
jgi:hypothetical protein